MDLKILILHGICAVGLIGAVILFIALIRTLRKDPDTEEPVRPVRQEFVPVQPASMPQNHSPVRPASVQPDPQTTAASELEPTIRVRRPVRPEPETPAAPPAADMQASATEPTPVAEPPAFRFCAKCGKKLPATAKFCTGCGNPISG